MDYRNLVKMGLKFTTYLGFGILIVVAGSTVLSYELNSGKEIFFLSQREVLG